MITQIVDKWLYNHNKTNTTNQCACFVEYMPHQITKLKCFSPRLAVVFAQSNEASCWVENEDVVGAAPTGGAPTTSEWSTILLPTKVQLY